MARARISRIAEFVALYFGVPLLLRSAQLAHLRVPVIPVLLLASAIVFAVLWRDPTFDRSSLTAFRIPAREALRVLLRFLICGALLALLLAWRAPKLFFSFPRANPVFWTVVMIAYPVISVYPQGILYRAFYLHRYAECFPERLRLPAGALAFSFAHILFGNLYAPLFTFFGGLLFLDSYRRTHSLLFSGLEHSLYGDFLFTIGWGAFFYEGTIRLLSS